MKISVTKNFWMWLMLLMLVVDLYFWAIWKQESYCCCGLSSKL